MSLSLFTNDPFLNDPFFSESRIAPFSNMFGGNMNMNRMMTAMSLRITETDDKFKVSRSNHTFLLYIFSFIILLLYIFNNTISFLCTLHSFEKREKLA